MSSHESTKKLGPSSVLALAVASIISPAVAQDLVLEEVVVTATKRASKIQDISGTVNVLTGASIDRLKAF